MSRRPSLRRRLQRRLLWPLLALFVASGALAFWLSIYFANQVYDGWLYDSANSLALLVDRQGDRATCELPVAAEEIFVWDDTDSTFFTVRGERSGVLAANADLPAVPLQADRYRDGLLFDSVGAAGRIKVMALELDAGRAGEQVWVLVGETDGKRRRLANSILLAVLLPQLALIAAVLLAVRYGVDRGLRPLQAIARKVEFQRPEALQPLSDDRVPVEVLPLTRAVDALLAGFQGVLASQRKFIADAAHQLRTPLTAIKLNVERALAEDGEQTGQILRELRLSAERAVRLSNQLLMLARAESGHGRPERWEPIDLLELARESGADWVPRALGKNIELTLLEPPVRALVNGDAVMLRAALDNVLDNAIKYHAGNGHITIAVESGDPCRLRIEDDGPGIPVEFQGRVFERFFRGDRSGRDGTGLGLPIVGEVAAAHRGTVRLAPGADGRGLRVLFEFPPAT